MGSNSSPSYQRGENGPLLRRRTAEEQHDHSQVPSNGEDDNNNNHNHRLRSTGSGGRLVLILLSVVTVAACTGLSCLQIEINGLNKQLQQELSQIGDIRAVLKVHEDVIARFNESVTNSDVVARLDSLETNWMASERDLRKELQRTKDAVRTELNQTVELLSSSVKDAERVITEQVDIVKKDVEQYVIDTQAQFSMENSFMVYQLAGTFTLLSCLISMWHMTAHLRRMNQPDVQRKILAILWMSPIYAVTSWFSLVFHPAEGYLAIIKDGYEAYIIYQFLSFCIAVLGKGDRNKVVDLLARRADHLTPPFRLCGLCEAACGCCRAEPYENNRALADAILLQCQRFAMQFVFFRPLTTTAMVVLEQLHYYGAGDGPADYRSPQFYITIVQNLSIFIAFTGLLKFYHAVQDDLAWCRPFAKFLCIKGVVFMTFWQGLAISILAQTTDVGGADADEWAKSAQNFLICLEMLLFSIAHFNCFPTEEWEEGYRVKHTQGNFGDSIALRDFLVDLKLVFKNNDKKKKHKRPASIPEGDDESDAETDALSAPVSEGIDEERAVALALEESLGMMSDDDDPEIVEAKRRLIESKVLSPKFFEELESESSDDIDVEEARRRLRNLVDPTLLDFGDSDEGNNGVLDVEVNEDSVGDTEDHVDQSASTLSDSDEESHDSMVPTERTSLLSNETLRPSIFTTVAAMAEKGEKKSK